MICSRTFDVLFFWLIVYKTFLLSGARIRAAVAQVMFDDFHRHSNQILITAVFGMNEKGQINKEVRFKENNLVCNLKLPHNKVVK